MTFWLGSHRRACNVHLQQCLLCIQRYSLFDRSPRPLPEKKMKIQENEVMQVASLCYTAEPALAGSGYISPNDALQLQLFELEQDILQQAEFLAKKSQSHHPAKAWVMSKEALARFKSAGAKLPLRSEERLCWIEWLLKWMQNK